MPPKLLLGLLLTLSLLAKLGWMREVPTVQAQIFAAKAEAMLRDRGFAVERQQRKFGIVLLARSGLCRVLIAESPPHGTLEQPLAAMSRNIGTLRFAWRGEVYDRAPKWAALADYFLWRELSRVGFALPRHAVAGFAQTPECGGLDWRELASV